MIRKWSIICLILITYLFCSSPLSIPAPYSVIERKETAHSKITSIFPKGWVKNSLNCLHQTRMGRLKSTSRIREIFWLPSVSSADEFDMVEFALDDDHFASKLAELGFAVHLIQPKEIEKSPLAVMESVNWRIREGKVLGRQMAIIGQELSSAHVLNYLSEVRPFQVQLGRIELLFIPLDSPPYDFEPG